MVENRASDSDEERMSALSRRVSNLTLQGWIIIERNDRDFYAVLSYPAQNVNHTVHAILTVFTCLVWGIVWLIIYAGRRKERRLRISIDPDLRLSEETMTIG